MTAEEGAARHPELHLWKKGVWSRDERGRELFDISAYGWASRGMLRRVWLAPAPFARLMAWTLGLSAVILIVVAVAAFGPDSSATAEDREFFPFIAAFFTVGALAALLYASVATLIARLRGTHRWEGNYRVLDEPAR